MRTDMETRLRTALAEQARRAPDGAGLAERIVAEASARSWATHRPRNRAWRTWSLPLVAAGAVAAVVAAVIGVREYHPAAQHIAPVGGSSVVTGAPAPSPASSPAPSPQVRTTSPAPSSPVVPPPVAFHVVDLTFVSPDRGWALGSGQCFSAPASRCTATLHTTDGGATWTSVQNPPANVPDAAGACTDPCVRHLRFANNDVGYAFGPSAFFMTTDRGVTWQRLPGGADALETLDGDVIRVGADHRGCPPACTYRVQTAALGSSSWRDAVLPSAPVADGVALERVTGHAYLALFENPAGGAGPAFTTLYASTDDGRSWAAYGEPCRSSGVSGEVDTRLIAAGGADGSLTALCTPRTTGGWQFTTTSTDGGATFRPGYERALGGYPAAAMAAVSASELFVVTDDLYRSTDGGVHWRRQHAEGGSGPFDASWIGFESTTVGRVVSADGSTISTTIDGGTTWTAHTFP